MVSRAVERRRRAVLDRPWSWLRQVHGDRVIVVRAPGEGAGEAADAAVSASPDVALAVLTADCAPVALASPEGVLGAVHAGWRGLMAGVLERSVESMRALGATDIGAVLGPCIHPECYEFSEADLERVAARLGDGVRSHTATGAPALDLRAGVRSCLAATGVTALADLGCCTACSPDHYSHRARGDRQRQGLVVWRPE